MKSILAAILRWLARMLQSKPVPIRKPKDDDTDWIDRA